MKFLATGEIIFDVFGDEAVIGGAPLNFCAHCVASGAQASLISGVGKDSLGKKAVECLKRFGVDTRFVSENSLETGRCIVTVSNGNPSYDVLRPAAYDSAEADIESVREYAADVFAFGTLIQREEKSRETVRKIVSECCFKEIFCDINLRKNCYDEESCRFCFENATILKLSEEEEPLLAPFGLYNNGKNEREKLRNIAAVFPNICLVLFTKGENGSLIYDAVNGKYESISAVKAKVVSTVGAGDSYSAAFLCEYLKSGDIAKAGKAGAALSAYVVSRKEAIPE